MGVVPRSDDGSVAPDSIFAKWGEVSLAAGDAFGKSLRTVDESKQGLLDAGFVDVTEQRFKWPIGGWSKNEKLKEIGLYNRCVYFYLLFTPPFSDCVFFFYFFLS